MNRDHTLLVSAALTVTVLTLSACGSSAKKAAPTTRPSGSAAGDPHSANVEITAATGCTPDKTTFPAGPINFTVANKDAAAVSEIELLGGERIVGEKENIPPGFGGTFTATVDAGTYTIYCPGAANEKTSITVTGSVTSAAASGTGALLATGVKQYSDYVAAQVGYLVTSAQALATALHGTDLAAAQDAYKKARPYYEKIEPVAESFVQGKDNLDADIDARVDDVPLPQLTGFHRIEEGLFAEKKLDGLAAYGDGLVTNCQKLQSLTTGLTYQPSELANGAQELLDEVSSSKITGEEERYSHIDLLDFQANDEGAQQAFADLQPALTKIDPTLTTTISDAFAALNTLVDKYRSSADASGFALYGTLTDADKKALAAAVKAVQEPLSRVASKVSSA